MHETVARAPKQLFIAGIWRDAKAGSTFDVVDPATGEVLCPVADASPEDGVDAVTAAAAAQDGWAAVPTRQRGELLRGTYELLTDRADDLALLLTLEMGKPLAEAKAEIAYAADFFRWFSEEAVRLPGRYTRSPDGTARFLTGSRPVGPCLLITPWNFPMAMAARKIAPAMAAGCTMVLKPAEQTPLSALALTAVLEEVGLPPGVLNVVTTTAPGQVVEPLLRRPEIRKLSFTGSTATGRWLMTVAAENLLRLSLELGGNAPFLVFDDADLNEAVEGAMVAKLRNGGQACTAANRFLVAESVAEEFTARLADRMGRVAVGPGTQPGVTLGPLIEEQARDKVAALVADAVDGGAKALVGGTPAQRPGWFFPPTVLTAVPDAAAVLHEEIFGPVAPITTFRTEDEAVAAANRTTYGLVSYLYTNDLRRALRVGERLETGMVGLNQGLVSNAAAPFGGVKHSGFGREGGEEGIAEYLATQYLAVAI
ncbi:MAG TPA: NAD-dependent succinate-semialdehyde dehydrogenase [Acidimicrobiia bacterium]|nr:NAD-dependent succinate-semialdehyde dehydrogenase [Acidimicrobiia bacterium]HMC38928.1 NAD-dependent succinate-semialdehyde dehydrogenase [Acidimicrobiales bacterium]HMC79901.1 NAD-dependent succinate-semialdehyde dehydrogenase [Acidimicrobiia bacterium]